MRPLSASVCLLSYLKQCGTNELNTACGQIPFTFWRLCIIGTKTNWFQWCLGFVTFSPSLLWEKNCIGNWFCCVMAYVDTGSLWASLNLFFAETASKLLILWILISFRNVFSKQKNNRCARWKVQKNNRLFLFTLLCRTTWGVFKSLVTFSCQLSKLNVQKKKIAYCYNCQSVIALKYLYFFKLNANVSMRTHSSRTMPIFSRYVVYNFVLLRFSVLNYSIC